MKLIATNAWWFSVDMNIIQRTLFEGALAARQQAYAPYSRFCVGASLRSVAGHYYHGCNVENAAYGLSICAEMNAIVQMVAAGDRQISELLIIGGADKLCYPCGACRQVIREFAVETTQIHLSQVNEQVITKQFAELLPFSFGAEDLNESSIALK